MTEASGVGGSGVGTVVGLWRFPVKSMQGEAVDTLVFVGPGPGTAGGVAGDRAWGVVDAASGRVLSAKTVPALLQASAASRDQGAVTITLPDGTVLDSEDRGLADGALSDWLGRRVELRSAAGDAATAYEMTFDPPNDDAELVPIETPLGSFCDLTGVHVLTTGSLATMAATHPAGDWAVRRFRPNVLVDTGPAAGDYPEDAWVGGPLAMGNGRGDGGSDRHGVTLDVLMRTVRCAVPLRAQPAAGPAPALARDVGIYRTMAAEHDNHLGVYCDVVRGGTVAVGDEVGVG